MKSALILTAAILAEVAGTTCLKLSAGLSRPWFVLGTVVLYLISFAGLALALRRIDMSVAYAIWSGLGMALITLVGVLAFDEPFTAGRFLCMVLILVGVVGLNLAPAGH